MKNTNPFHRHGFTLVELLIVIVIIAVLVTISLVMIFRFRLSGEKVIATNNLRQIQAANMNYAADNSGRFVPPTGMIDVGGVQTPFRWFENPEFIRQIKGEAATYKSDGTFDTSLQLSFMDPAVVRERKAGYTLLGSSFGYTRAEAGTAAVQSKLANSAASVAFITATEAFVEHATKAKIAYRHPDKAIAAFYDGHVEPVTRSKVSATTATDAFWTP